MTPSSRAKSINDKLLIRGSTSKYAFHSAGATIQYITKNVTINAKERVTLRCDAIGYPLPTISWVYNNATLMSSFKSNLSEIKEWTEEKYSIDRKPVEKMENCDNMIAETHYPSMNRIQVELHMDNCSTGVHHFDCIASNSYNEDKRNTTVESYLQPIFEKSTKDNNSSIEIIEGLPIILTCDVVGYPMPEIIWLKVCKSHIELPAQIGFGDIPC